MDLDSQTSADERQLELGAGKFETRRNPLKGLRIQLLSGTKFSVADPGPRLLESKKCVASSSKKVITFGFEEDFLRSPKGHVKLEPNCS